MRNFAEVKSRQVPSRKEISGWRVCPIFLLPDRGRPAGTPGPRRVPAEDVLSEAVGFAFPSARDPFGVADGATASPRRRRLRPAGGGPARPGHSPPPGERWAAVLSWRCSSRLRAAPPDRAKPAGTS